jgi:hypothetical protein
VLKTNGRFVAATNGQHHLRELWQIGQELWQGTNTQLSGLLSGEWTFSFRLDNGAEWLTAVFDHVTAVRYEDQLVVTEAEPILNFLLSTSLATENAIPTPETIAQVRQKLAQQIAQDGAIYITKEVGVFTAW